MIESFNALWSANFFSRRLFQSVTEVQQELPHFEQVARYRHPWPELGLRTADQLAPDFVPVCLPSNFNQHRAKSLPLTMGFVHFVRFVDLNGSFSILNEPWQLEPERWAGKTIRATLDLAQQQLLVFHQANRQACSLQIAQFDYAPDEPICPLQDCYHRPRPAFWSVAS